jgi:hypothetical protein
VEPFKKQIIKNCHQCVLHWEAWGFGSYEELRRKLVCGNINEKS